MDKNGVLVLDNAYEKLNNIKKNIESTGLEKKIDLHEIAMWLWDVERGISTSVYIVYFEFFNKFAYTCCTEKLTKNNIDVILESLELVLECFTYIKKDLQSAKRCVCCSKYVNYLPLSPYFDEMLKKNGGNLNGVSETLNREEYSCPMCGSADRDRLIIEYLLKNGLPFTLEKKRVLQIAPAKPIEYWLREFCPNVIYESTDLYMDGVTFKCDIQNMKNVADNTYDYVICSHVLEHVQDDIKAMKELERIIKKDGKVLFLVPIDLKRKEIDEEWGLSEEENWRRFGQNDHCRAYSKQGLLERLEKVFCVQQLGKDYFGENVFDECGLKDTSTLYVLGKNISRICN